MKTLTQMRPPARTRLKQNCGMRAVGTPWAWTVSKRWRSPLSNLGGSAGPLRRVRSRRDCALKTCLFESSCSFLCFRSVSMRGR